MKDPGGYIGQALRDCGAIKPKKRVTAREAAIKYAERFHGPMEHDNECLVCYSRIKAFLNGVRFAQRQAKREGK